MSGTVSRLRPLALAFALLLAACADDTSPPSDPRDVVELRWLKAYSRESRSDVETGLLWALSLTGAQLPRGSRVIRWHGDQMTVDLARAQVQDGTAPAWRQFIAEMKASGEYRARGALDVGRFVTLALGSPDRYYALTGATANYTLARGRYEFEGRPAAIVKSAVALGSRRIDISVADRVGQIAFVGFEGKGSFAAGTFEPHEMELLDTMRNGQLRFALYGLDGRLEPGASTALTTAGKPAKCMWCHEAGLQPTFVDYPAVSGYRDRGEFEALLKQRRALLLAYREQLDTQIEYRHSQDHTYVELLYESFEEPSRERLAREWGIPVESAAQRLRGKPTHAQAEHGYLGSEIYWRQDVDDLAPYAVLEPPPSVREESPPVPAAIGVPP